MLHLHALMAMALAAAVGLLPILPPEHAHDTEDHAGQHHVKVHRHVEPHVSRGQHDEGAALDDSDPVVTLEPLLTAPGQVVLPTPVLPDVSVVEPSLSEPRTTLQDIPRQPIHGPPRGPSRLRAPPSQPSL